IETYGPIIRNSVLVRLSLSNCCARKRAVLVMSLLPVLFLSIRTCRPSTPALEQACKRTAQLCAAILHARSADDSVHCLEDQLSQELIMNEMIDGGFVAQFVTSQVVYPCDAFTHPTRTVSGMPNCVIRLSTAHFTTASARWVARLRAHNRPPNN